MKTDGLFRDPAGGAHPGFTQFQYSYQIKWHARCHLRIKTCAATQVYYVILNRMSQIEQIIKYDFEN